MSKNPLAVDLQACADYIDGMTVAENYDGPAHCILGTADKMTPLKSGLALAKALGCTPDILDGFGHMLPVEAPKETLASLRQFIESVEKA